MDFRALRDSLGTTVPRYFIPRHLDSPLIADKLTDDCNDSLLIQPSTREGYNLRLAVRHVLGNIARLSQQTPRTTMLLQSNFLVRVITPEEMIILVDTVTPTVKWTDAAENVANDWCTMVRKILGSSNDHGLHQLSVKPLIKRWFLREDTFEVVWDRVNNECSRGGQGRITSQLDSQLSDYIYLDRHRCLLIDLSNKLIRVMTFDMFLAVKDCCGVRCRSLLAADFFYPEGRVMSRILQQVQWQTDCIRLFKNDGYEIAKQTESLSKAWMTSLTDSVFSSLGPYHKMVGKISQKGYKLANQYNIPTSEVDQLISRYTSLLQTCTLQETVELFGLQKLCLYPFIYSAKGGRSAADEAFRTSTTSFQSMKQLRACWAIDFVIGYIERNHCWPILEIGSRSTHTLTAKWYRAGFTRFSFVDCDIDDWDDIRFGKVFEFNYHDNYLDLIDDKAISYYRDNLEAYWDGPATAKSERRLLLEMLNRSSISLRNICSTVSTRSVPTSWKVVSLYPKEKELKVNARMFSMMVLEMRTYFTCLEANLADQVFPYLRSQTMTKDKVSITHQFFTLTGSDYGANKGRFFIECDLSRWNLRWRGDVVHYIGRDLDDLFGTIGLYTYVHQFFSESVIVVRTPRLRPIGIENINPPESDLVWYDHLGGFEGIAQKHWSLCTYAMIHWAMRDIPCTYALKGQGDNQVLSVVVAKDDSTPWSDQLRQITDQITTRLSETCAKVNQELKPEECLESQTVLTYSKNVYVRGAEFFTSLKFASKLYARTSDEIPSLSSDLSGLASSCLAAAEYSRYPLRLGVLQAFYLTRELFFRVQPERAEVDSVSRVFVKEISSSIPLIVKRLLRYPSSFGGFSLAMFSDFLYRGGADPAAKDWSALVRMARVDRLAAGIHNAVSTNTFFSEDADPMILIESPYSLPLRSHQTMKGKITNLADQFLDNYTRNQDVGSLTTIATGEYQRAVKESLLQMAPFNPLIAGEIYGSSAVAEVDRLKRMFISTRTVQVASRKAGQDSSGIIIETSGLEAFSILLMIINVNEMSCLSTCSPISEHSKFIQLRSLWGKFFEKRGLSTVEIVGLESIPPLLFPTVIKSQVIVESALKVCLVPGEAYRESRGPYIPYLGARTAITRSEHGYRIVGDNRPSRAVERLGEILHTPVVGPGLKELIRQLALHRGPIDLADDTLNRVQIGGTAHHRFDASRRERGAYACGVGNLATWCFFVTDEITGVSGSTTDFGLMFQEFYVCALGLLNMVGVTHGYSHQYSELAFIMTSTDVPTIVDSCVDTRVVPRLIPEETWANSHLVYDSRLWTLSLSGPIAVRSMIRTVKIDDLPRDQLMSEAVRAEFSRLVRLNSDTDYVASVHRTSLPAIKIDLAEILRLQLKRIVDAASMCALLNLCYRWITRIIVDDTTIKLVSDLRHISSSLASVIVPLLEYSALLSDHSLGFCVGNAGYHHSDVPDTPQEVITGLIVSTTRKMLLSHPSVLGATIVFPTEPGNYGSLVYLARLGQILYRASTTGLKYAFVVSAVRATNLKDVLGIKQEGDRQRSLYSETRRIMEWTDVPYSVKRNLQQLYQGDLVCLCHVDHKQITRQARLLNISSTLQHSTETTIQIQERPSNLKSLYPWLSDEKTTISGARHVRNSAMVLSNPSFRYGRYYPAWSHMCVTLGLHVLVLIGVGRGVAGLAALDAGYKQVIGVDLGSEYNIRRIRNGYPPDSIAHSKYSRRFTWHSSSLEKTSHTGQTICLASLQDSISEGALLIIDITPHSTIDQLASLDYQQVSPCVTAFRLRSSRSQYYADCCRLARFMKLHYLNCYSFGDGIEIYAAGTMACHSPGVPCRPILELTPSQTSLQGYPIISSSDNVDSLVSCNRICLSLVHCNYTRNEISQSYRSYWIEHGRYLESSSYAEWSIESFRAIICYLLLYCDKPEECMLQLQVSEKISVVTNRESITISTMIWKYRRLLEGPVSYLVSCRAALK